MWIANVTRLRVRKLHSKTDGLRPCLHGGGITLLEGLSLVEETNIILVYMEEITLGLSQISCQSDIAGAVSTTGHVFLLQLIMPF